jgi:hypothetical protein
MDGRPCLGGWLQVDVIQVDLPCAGQGCQWWRGELLLVCVSQVCPLLLCVPEAHPCSPAPCLRPAALLLRNTCICVLDKAPGDACSLGGCGLLLLPPRSNLAGCVQVWCVVVREVTTSVVQGLVVRQDAPLG